MLSSLVIVVIGCGSSANNKGSVESIKGDSEIEKLFDGVWCCGYQPIDEQDAEGVHIEGMSDYFVRYNSAEHTFNAVCDVLYTAPVELGFTIKWHGTWSADDKSLTEVTEKENVEFEFNSEQIDNHVNIEGIKNKYIGAIVGKVEREIRDKEINDSYVSEWSKSPMKGFTLLDGKKEMIYVQPDGELAEVAHDYFHIGIFGGDGTTENEEYIDESEMVIDDYVPYPDASATVVIDLKGNYIGDYRRKEGDYIIYSIGDNELSMSSSKCKVVTYRAEDGQGVILNNGGNKVVDVYLRPDNGSKVIERIPPNEGCYPEPFPCLGTDGAFYKIRYKGKIGFVEKSKVEWWPNGIG